MNKFRIWLMVVVFTFLCLSPLYAGIGYMLFCHDPACNFREEVDFGRGFSFKLLTGYCVEDEHFVYITWKVSEKPPEPVGYVWDVFRGKNRPLYACPKCDKPFLAIGSVKDIKHCPKCGKASLSTIQVSLYD